MASFHSRSNSFPSQTHPLVECVEDHLCRLKASEATSTSASSVSSKLAALRDVYEGINNLIQMPSVQQSLVSGECCINELLEGSLRLADLCAFSRDIVYLTKESVHHLQSSIRRNKVETIAAADINAYAASRKKINKMVNKCLKSFNHKCRAVPDNDCDLKAIGTMLKKTESVGFSILNSALVLLSGEKETSSWSFLSKLTQTSRVNYEDLCWLKSLKSIDSTTVHNKLKKSEKMIQELEEGLESLYRSLVKTRVSLLNVLSN